MSPLRFWGMVKRGNRAWRDMFDRCRRTPAQSIRSLSYLMTGLSHTAHKSAQTIIGLTISKLHHDEICGGVVIRQPVRFVLDVYNASYFAYAVLWKLVRTLNFAIRRYPCRHGAKEKGWVDTPNQILLDWRLHKQAEKRGQPATSPSSGDSSKWKLMRRHEGVSKKVLIACLLSRLSSICWNASADTLNEGQGEEQGTSVSFCRCAIAISTKLFLRHTRSCESPTTLENADVFTWRVQNAAAR